MSNFSLETLDTPTRVWMGDTESHETLHTLVTDNRPERSEINMSNGWFGFGFYTSRQVGIKNHDENWLHVA